MDLFESANSLLTEGISISELYSDFKKQFAHKFTPQVYGKQDNCVMGALDLFNFIDGRLDPVEKAIKGVKIVWGKYKVNEDTELTHCWVEAGADILDPSGELQLVKSGLVKHLEDDNYEPEDEYASLSSFMSHREGWDKYISEIRLGKNLTLYQK